MIVQLRSGELTVETVGYQLVRVVRLSYEGETLNLCRLHGFAFISFDRPPQLGAVGPVVYDLNEFSPLSSLVIRCRFGDNMTMTI